MHRFVLPLLFLTLILPAYANARDGYPPDGNNRGTLQIDATTGEPTPGLNSQKTAAAKNTAQKTSPESSPPEPRSEISIEWGAIPPREKPHRRHHPSMDGTTSALASSLAGQNRHRKALHPHFWKTETEWLGIRTGISTYGATFSLSIATLRWKNIFLDVAEVTGGAWKRTVHFFGSTLVGMPFWLTERQELRMGTGISAGYLRFKSPVDSDSSEFSGSGIYAARVKSYILLPLQVSYIYHYQRHMAFQLCATVAFPIHFENIYLSRQPVDDEDYDIQYRPFAAVTAGLRF